MKLVEALLAGALSCALFMALHAADWKRVFGKRPQPPWSYVAGVVGMAIPFTALMLLWRDWSAIGGAASVIVGGGAAVLYGYYVRGVARRDEQPQCFTSDEWKAILDVVRGQLAATEKKLMWALRELEKKNAEQQDTT